MSQILMVWSSEQLARMLGFWGSNATQRTQPLLANTNLELNHHKKCSLDSNGWDVPVPGQRRLALKCARRPYGPDLDGFVIAAADEHITIDIEADRRDTVFGIS